MASIKVENLFVRYSLQQKNNSKGLFSKKHQSINALKDVSFDVNSGDRIGVIGTNGSGKSTLLKAISGALPANQGKLNVSGDVLSLLDRTAGLIRKATLNENARLKAYSLGLFGAEVDNFITNSLQQSGLSDRADFPMNSLSTGMAAKFNLAINSQIFKPITILDEWVGTLDSSQIGKGSIMEKLSASANILLLASHNEPLIKEVCNKVILLDRGELKYYGDDFNIAFKELNQAKLINSQPSIISTNSKKAREQINVLLIAKSGGYLLKKLLSNVTSDRYEFVIHNVTTKLKDVPVGEKIIFFVRNPIERFARIFYMRYNKGAPFYNSQWSESETSVFQRFSSANQLAEALSDKDSLINSQAILSLNKVRYLTTQISDYLGNQNELESRQKDIKFIGNADRLVDELERLQSEFELNVDIKNILNNKEIKHFSSLFSHEISEKGSNALQLLYQHDTTYFKYLTQELNAQNKKIT